MDFGKQLSQSPRFTGEDIRFIHEIFHMELVTHEDLEFIMSHDKLRQPLLDSRRLFEAVEDESEFAGISEYLFYYVKVRQILLTADLEDTGLADFLTRVAVELAECKLRREAEDFQRPVHLIAFPHLSMQVLTVDDSSGTEVTVTAEVGHYRMVVNGLAPVRCPRPARRNSRIG